MIISIRGGEAVDAGHIVLSTADATYLAMMSTGRFDLLDDGRNAWLLTSSQVSRQQQQHNANKHPLMQPLSFVFSTGGGPAFGG
jgi:hypothetical protein